MDEMDALITAGLDPAADLAPVDFDGDGRTDWDTLAEDPRVEVYDMGADAAMVAVDLDSDGDWEAIASDQDGDGGAEVIQRDRDGDGSLEALDVVLPGSLPFGSGGSAF